MGWKPFWFRLLTKHTCFLAIFIVYDKNLNKNLVKIQIHENNSAKYFKNESLKKTCWEYITVLSSRLLSYIQLPNRGQVVRDRTVDCLYLSTLVIKWVVMELNLTVMLATWRQNHNRETHSSSCEGIHTNKQSNKKALQK